MAFVTLDSLVSRLPVSITTCEAEGAIEHRGHVT